MSGDRDSHNGWTNFKGSRHSTVGQTGFTGESSASSSEDFNCLTFSAVAEASDGLTVAGSALSAALAAGAASRSSAATVTRKTGRASSDVSPSIHVASSRRRHFRATCCDGRRTPIPQRPCAYEVRRLAALRCSVETRHTEWSLTTHALSSARIRTLRAREEARSNRAGARAVTSVAERSRRGVSEPCSGVRGWRPLLRGGRRRDMLRQWAIRRAARARAR